MKPRLSLPVRLEIRGEGAKGRAREEARGAAEKEASQGGKAVGQPGHSGMFSFIIPQLCRYTL